MKNDALVLTLCFKHGIRQGGLVGDVNRQEKGLNSSSLWGGVGWASNSLFGPSRAEEIIRSCRLSSLLWRWGDQWFVPAPAVAVSGLSFDQVRRARKLTWVPVDSLGPMLSGLGVPEPVQLFVEDVTVSAALDRSTNAAVPYYRRRIVPREGVEGVIVAEGPGEMLEDLGRAFCLLGDNGLGGERSSGWGVFRPGKIEVGYTPFASLLEKEGYRYLTLGSFLPADDEVDKIEAMEDPAGYTLCRQRGFVGETDVIKPTVVSIGPGSLLDFRPEGCLLDITPPATGHPVIFNGRTPFIAVDFPSERGRG